MRDKRFGRIQSRSEKRIRSVAEQVSLECERNRDGSQKLTEFHRIAQRHKRN